MTTISEGMASYAAPDFWRREIAFAFRLSIQGLRLVMSQALFSSFKCLGLLLGIGWIAACNLSAPAPPTPLPTETSAIPLVQIRYPPHNQRVVEGVIFDIDILATDPAAGIQRVELYVDEELLQSSETETQHQQSYRIATNWLAKGIGWHKFSAIAYRTDGTASHPHVIALEVVPPS